MSDNQSSSDSIWTKQQKILGRIALGGALSEILDDIVRLAEEQSEKGMIASILLISPDGRHLSVGAAPSLPDTYNDAIEGMEIGDGEGSCGTAAATGKAVYVSDISADPLWKNFRALAEKHGLRACWSVPFKARDGSVLGTFANYYRQPESPSPLDKEIIETIALTAAIAVERDALDAARCRVEEANATIRGELEHRVKNAFALAQSIIVLNARSAADPHHLAEIASSKLRALSDAQNLIIRAYDGEEPGPIGLNTLVDTIISPLVSGENGHAFSISENCVAIPSESISGLAMILHELATNSAKYGALLNSEGKIAIEVTEWDDGFRMDWMETGGPSNPTRGPAGFGTRMIASTLRQLGATMESDLDENGLRLKISFRKAV